MHLVVKSTKSQIIYFFNFFLLFSNYSAQVCAPCKFQILNPIDISLGKKNPFFIKDNFGNKPEPTGISVSMALQEMLQDF